MVGPPYADVVLDFRGRPPFVPFVRAAAVLAADFALPANASHGAASVNSRTIPGTEMSTSRGSHVIVLPLDVNVTARKSEGVAALNSVISARGINRVTPLRKVNSKASRAFRYFTDVAYPRSVLRYRSVAAFISASVGGFVMIQSPGSAARANIRVHNVQCLTYVRLGDTRLRFSQPRLTALRYQDDDFAGTGERMDVGGAMIVRIHLDQHSADSGHARHSRMIPNMMGFRNPVWGEANPGCLCGGFGARYA
jgi:hypothetical protein